MMGITYFILLLNNKGSDIKSVREELNHFKEVEIVILIKGFVYQVNAR